MTPKSEPFISPPADEKELRTYLSIASQSLFFPEADIDEWIEREGRQNVRVAKCNGAVTGGLVIQRMGLWVGGRSVPMGGVRMVGVAPEYRAGGFASALMRATLDELHRDQIPISVLFPATQPVYRRPGYEPAGVHMGYRLETSAIDVRDRTLALHPIEEPDWPGLREVYAERAKRTSGNVDRNEWLWQRTSNPPSWIGRTYGYQVVRDGEPEGYIVFKQKVNPGADHDHELVVIDWVALSAGAGRRLWTLLADHRSMAKYVHWHGPEADPLLHLLAEQRFQVTDRLDWMLRVVDVRAALEARGYPTEVTTELHLDVIDDVLPHNHGRFVVRVSGGRAAVEQGGRGDLRIDVRGLAALFTGRLTPADLGVIGYVEGPESVLAGAAAVFAGPTPWMPDIF